MSITFQGSTILIVCPGFHDRSLTQHLYQQLTPSFQQIAPTQQRSVWVVPTDQIMPTDLGHIQTWFENLALDRRAVLHWLGFSAGTIAALTLASTWQLQGGQVGAVILCDGWGVPILPNPWRVYRVCHDRWTHDSWQGWGVATPGFYAEPSVSHLELWGACDRVVGVGSLRSAAPTAMRPYSVMDYWLACLS